jgi:FHA domain-containing protein
VPQQAATAGTESDAVAALLAAFLEGVDVPGLQVDALTPSFMFRIGALLRESTRGTVDLMVARAALKREVRAQMTVIAMRENNPLKFSPTVDIALQHLLGPLENGFTPPIAAVQDAYDDLRAHQVGMVAGMRAALEGVLARFDPARLETQLTPRAGLAGLLPSNRQARLWEAFETLHAQLATEAEDAFHELFGAAFLQAYEAHIDSIKRELKHE